MIRNISIRQISLVSSGNNSWLATPLNAIDRYEPNNSDMSASQLLPNEAQRHSFHVAGCEDREDWLFFQQPTAGTFNGFSLELSAVSGFVYPVTSVELWNVTTGSTIANGFQRTTQVSLPTPTNQNGVTRYNLACGSLVNGNFYLIRIQGTPSSNNRYEVHLISNPNANLTGGADVMCWNGVTPAFTLVGDIPANTSITWSASPCNSFTFCSGTGTSFAPQATKKSGGYATITVTINAGCGANTVITRNIWIGPPSTPLPPIYLNLSLLTSSSPTLYVCPNETVGFNLVSGTVGDYQGTTHFEWAFSCGDTLNTVNNGLGLTAQIANGQTPCGDVRVRAVNACGASGWLVVDTEYGGMCNNYYTLQRSVEVFSNPTDTETNVQIKNLPNVNYAQNNENTPAGFAYDIQVVNQQGNTVKTLNTDKVRQKIITSDLPKGHYQVLVKRGNILIYKHLLVQR
ncbi:MAG: T9SS C-terminal target domain-containing protein [Bacteroidetes bacterium]|nr:MAG: T9SS C-terminal target domain-containing protein [Bacteroidota bacterium]